ncbi:prickle planar cell polarity protein 3-A-like isoform X2 [Biomphalaria glabrata]|uniref:Prickle planar cell polarity protein 3-A-like isoform X2 n=1 Tax=Biomphalaria glabrata TaxID=6526 RepID=A0A9W3ANL6_BIOGL|nr:prickle planar cell polarity protein 3-A-like isoform X2 [Biomphalaria glabrata]
MDNVESSSISGSITSLESILPILKLQIPDIVVNEVDHNQPCLNCGDHCPGYVAHDWRNICIHCKCLREEHDIFNENFVNIRDRLGWKRDDGPEKSVSKEKTLSEGYTWVPANLSSKKIREYMDQLPNHKVPKVDSDGERYRDIQVIKQLPKQDLSDLYCRFLDGDVEKKEFMIFRELRDQVAMGIGLVKECPQDTTCYNCKGELDEGELSVVASKVGPDALWHPACFTCHKCEELLVDLVYCHHAKHLYCERHYAELIRPRCPGCDELIFSAEYTKAMEENYHKEHLACHNCDKQLVACRYIVKEEHPYCIPCYQQLFAHNCDECGKPIGPDFKDLSYKDRHWHEFCFKCCGCQKSLVDQPFASKNDKIYCSDCHDNNFAARCDGCGEPFRGGMKKFEYKGKQWHDWCFVCSECNQPIGNKSFIPRDERVICVPCYESKYAQRCSKCGDVINKGGISYKNTPWHRECFTCTNCNKQLAGEKFTSKEEHPYCGDCYGELFAKRCCRCTKPITGIGGTKFISFEERHWHSDCFNCYKCDASMVGRGFLMNGEDIVCPECGRS